MNIIDFIYRLIEKFAAVSSMQVAALESEARTWYSAQLAKDTTLTKYLKEYGESWWFRTALAVIFIFVSKSLLEFVNDKKKEDDDDDDD